MIVLQTNHSINITVTNSFANGCNGNKINISDYVHHDQDIIASNGILRGTGELIKKSKNS